MIVLYTKNYSFDLCLDASGELGIGLESVKKISKLTPIKFFSDKKILDFVCSKGSSYVLIGLIFFFDFFKFFYFKMVEMCTHLVRMNLVS
jgi:hypothetical protein